jgi:hypothetical protein
MKKLTNQFLLIFSLGLMAFSSLTFAATKAVTFRFNTPIVYHEKSVNVFFMPNPPLDGPCVSGTKIGEITCTMDDKDENATFFMIYATIENMSVPLGALSITASGTNNNFQASNTHSRGFESKITLSTENWTSNNQVVDATIALSDNNK